LAGMWRCCINHILTCINSCHISTNSCKWLQNLLNMSKQSVHITHHSSHWKWEWPSFKNLMEQRTWKAKSHSASHETAHFL
jgi:hypothetical protein